MNQKRRESRLNSYITPLFSLLITSSSSSSLLLSSVPVLYKKKNMGFAVAKALVLLQLSLLCFTAFSNEEIETVSSIPAAAPSHHHHHHAHSPSLPPSHHHHHAHSPSHAPVHSPLHAPAHAPVYPPKPHTQPPVHPPTHSPPVKPSPHPPVKPPVHSPKPQPHPPVKPPVHSPKPQPHPPVKPPSYHFPRSFVATQGVVYCKSCKYSGVETLLGATPLPGATIKLQCNNTKYPLEVKATTDKNGYFFLEAPKKITNYGAHKCKVSLVSAPNTACSKLTDLHGGISGGALRPEKKYVSNNLPFVLYTVGPFAFEPKCPR